MKTPYTSLVLQIPKFLLSMCLEAEKYACLTFHEDGNFYFLKSIFSNLSSHPTGSSY